MKTARSATTKALRGGKTKTNHQAVLQALIEAIFGFDTDLLCPDNSQINDHPVWKRGPPILIFVL